MSYCSRETNQNLTLTSFLRVKTILIFFKTKHRRPSVLWDFLSAVQENIPKCTVRSLSLAYSRFLEAFELKKGLFHGYSASSLFAVI
jgi:hypothetical protein